MKQQSAHVILTHGTDQHTQLLVLTSSIPKRLQDVIQLRL